MARYCSYTIILPDESHLDNFVVEVNNYVVAYYPFAGEKHTTIYFDTPILLSHRGDLDGKTISLTQLAWALRDGESGDDRMYAYHLSPCSSCMGERYVLSRL